VAELSEHEATRLILVDALEYASIRVQYYVRELRDMLSARPAPSSLPGISKVWASVMSQRKVKGVPRWSNTTWDFLNAPGTVLRTEQIDRLLGDTVSDDAAAEAVLQEMEGAVGQVIEFFGNGQTRSTDDLVDLLQSIHVLRVDIRGRATFTAACYRRFASSWNNSRRAVRALLFLCRFQSAALTFAKATRYVPSFSDIEFEAVEYISSDVRDVRSTAPKSVGDALRTANSVNDQARILSSFGHKQSTICEIDSNFDRRRRAKTHIHAEIQSIHDYEHRGRRGHNDWAVHPYIGCSKLCCYLCDTFIRHHGVFKRRGSHFHISHRWTDPEAYNTREASASFSSTVVKTYSEVTENIHSFMTGKRMRSTVPLRPESTLGRTTAVTVTDQDAAEMTIESAMTSWMRVSRG